MKASERLTPERFAEIMAFPITYDEDSNASLRLANEFFASKKLAVTCV